MGQMKLLKKELNKNIKNSKKCLKVKMISDLKVWKAITELIIIIRHTN